MKGVPPEGAAGIECSEPSCPSGTRSAMTSSPRESPDRAGRSRRPVGPVGRPGEHGRGGGLSAGRHQHRHRRQLPAVIGVVRARPWQRRLLTLTPSRTAAPAREAHPLMRVGWMGDGSCGLIRDAASARLKPPRQLPARAPAARTPSRIPAGMCTSPSRWPITEGEPTNLPVEPIAESGVG